MTVLADYENTFRHARFRREEGVLLINLHTDGGKMVWSSSAHNELPYVFATVADDLENKVVVLSGSGEAFCDSYDTPSFKGRTSDPLAWDQIQREARSMLNNLLSIEVPMIGVANGPARIHAELTLLCDIVLASET